MSTTQIEHSRFHRLRARLPVSFWSVSRGQSECKQGHTVDLSAGGLLLRCGRLDEAFLADLVESGYTLDLHVQFREGGYELPARGKVVWMEGSSDGFLVRVCFIGLMAENEDLLHDFMLHQAGPQ